MKPRVKKGGKKYFDTSWENMNSVEKKKGKCNNTGQENIKSSIEKKWKGETTFKREKNC